MVNAPAKKILVVEDEAAMREALADKLSREGFAVLQAKNGEAGLELARAEHPDLILLDLVMPKLDGMAALKILRAESEWGRKVPVIVLTNLGVDDRMMRHVIENEPSYYLVKSDWKIEDVARKVKEALGIETPS